MERHRLRCLEFYPYTNNLLQSISDIVPERTFDFWGVHWKCSYNFKVDDFISGYNIGKTDKKSIENSKLQKVNLHRLQM